MPAARAPLAFLLLGLAGCQATEPRGGLLYGTFASPIQNRSGYLAVSLRNQGGVLNGRGWSTASPSLLGGAVVTGTYSPPNVQLAFHPRLGLTDWSFDGVFEGDTLKGEWGFGGILIEQVALPRVDTIPLGEYFMRVSGALVDSAGGSALFTYVGSGFLLTQSFQIQAAATSSLQVSWRRRELPAPGTYPLSGEGGPGPSVSFSFGEPEQPSVRYQLISGTITITLADRYVLDGSYRLSARSAEGDSISVSGRFSSGCIGGNC